MTIDRNEDLDIEMEEIYERAGRDELDPNNDLTWENLPEDQYDEDNGVVDYE